MAFWLLQLTLLASMSQAQFDAIFGNAGIASAAINLTGPETISVTSSYQGYYSFRWLTPGQYVVTPTLSGYTFTPTSTSITVGEGVGIGFVSFRATSNETGLVASPASFTLTTAGATQQLQVEATYSNGTSADVTSGATYASNSTSVAAVSQSGLVTAVGTGNATVIASYGGLASSVSITVSIPVPTYSISGSAGAASATVVVAGAATAQITASSTGAFSLSGLPSGTYTITPSLAESTFVPTSQPITITNANVTGVNFIATTTPSSVNLTWGAGTIQNPASGQAVAGYNVYRGPVAGGPYTQLNSSPVAGLTYVDSAVSSGQTWYYVCTTVDSLGNVSADSNQAVATLP
jgi:Bacterial Ig-like domain (group 2)